MVKFTERRFCSTVMCSMSAGMGSAGLKTDETIASLLRRQLSERRPFGKGPGIVLHFRIGCRLDERGSVDDVSSYCLVVLA